MTEHEFDKLTIDPATKEMLKKAQAEGVETIFNRAQALNPAPSGAEGACCRICSQGPCRVPPPKKKEGETEAEKKQRMGLCGATAETIVARNFARMAPSGAAAHNDHSRGTALLFKDVANGKAQGYEIKDMGKLRKVTTLPSLKVKAKRPSPGPKRLLPRNWRTRFWRNLASRPAN